EDMLRLYKPFIHDYDYEFDTSHVRALSDRLDETERELFGFDIMSLDWRHYWLEVQVPGLAKWCLPLLRGERIPEDPPPASTPRHAPVLAPTPGCLQENTVP